MKNRVIYYSKGGNTAKIANAIAKGAGVTAQMATPNMDLTDTGLLFVGGSIYAGKLAAPLHAMLENISPGQVTQVVVFSTAMGPSTPLAEIREILAPKGIPVSDKEFHCPAKFLFFNRKRPNGNDIIEATEFAAATLQEFNNASSK